MMVELLPSMMGGYKMNTKIKLNRVFKALRNAGYFARQNHSCCNTCGWSEVPEEKSKKVVFYHKQEGDRFKAGGDRVMVCWDGDGTEICNIARKEGFITNWDGSTETKIEFIDGGY